MWSAKKEKEQGLIKTLDVASHWKLSKISLLKNDIQTET